MNSVGNGLLFIVGAIIGGLIELVLAILFENSFRNFYRRVRRIWLLFLETLRATKFSMERERYRIGNHEVNVIILEGTPADPYQPDKVACHLYENPLVLPPELHNLKEEIEIEQQRIEGKNGKPDFHNGAMVALVNYHHSYTQIWEAPSLFLQFKETDYYTFLSTALKLDAVGSGNSSPSETLRAKYLSATSYRSPNPNFATSFGVNIAVVTDDNYLIVAKRGERGISHYHGVYAVPVMESVNPQLDRDANKQLDVFETVLRGLREELGIRNVSKDAVKLFTLQVDTRFYLFGLTGYIFAEGYSRDLITGIKTRGVRDWWESPEHLYIPFNPKNVAQFVEKNGGVARFHPAAFVSICQSLIYCFGQREVNKAFK